MTSTVLAAPAVFTLTDDQQHALDSFNQFLIDPIETVFVLSGHSGTGKTTLVKTMIERMPNFLRLAKLVDPTTRDLDVQLTATTNKAAENFKNITGLPVATIHSYLGLRVSTDYATGVSNLIPRSHIPKENVLLLIDEASYIDKQLLGMVFKLTDKCKIVFIGDPAQLTQVKAVGTPVFDAHFSGAHLSQVVRQAEDNPIVDLSTRFRDTVNSGEFFSFVPDGEAVKYLDRAAFNAAIEQEFTRPDWKYADSKILAWTNKCVIEYNHAISVKLKGDPSFQVGDYAVVNKFVTARRTTFKTDQLVQITGISPDLEEHGVVGNRFDLDNCATFFGPKSLASKNLRIKQAKAEDNLWLVETLSTTWVDLRSAFAATVNKSQGSTFERVFIDLDDVRRCNSGNQIARMLYVAVSRARTQVILTGDLV